MLLFSVYRITKSLIKNQLSGLFKIKTVPNKASRVLRDHYHLIILNPYSNFATMDHPIPNVTYFSPLGGRGSKGRCLKIR